MIAKTKCTFIKRFQIIFLLIAGMISTQFNFCQADSSEKIKITTAFKDAFDVQMADFLTRHKVKNNNIDEWLKDPGTTLDDIIRVVADFSDEIACVWPQGFFKEYVDLGKSSVYMKIITLGYLVSEEYSDKYKDEFRKLISKGTPYVGGENLLQGLEKMVNTAPSNLMLCVSERLLNFATRLAGAYDASVVPDDVRAKLNEDFLFSAREKKEKELREAGAYINLDVLRQQYGVFHPDAILVGSDINYFGLTEVLHWLEDTFFLVPRLVHQVRDLEKRNAISEETSKNFNGCLKAFETFAKTTQEAFGKYLDNPALKFKMPGDQYKKSTEYRKILTQRQTDPEIVAQCGVNNSAPFDDTYLENLKGYQVFLSDSGVLRTAYDDPEYAKAMYKAAQDYLHYIETVFYKGLQVPQTIKTLQVVVKNGLDHDTFKLTPAELESRGIDRALLKAASTDSNPPQLPNPDNPGETQNTGLSSYMTLRNGLLTAGGLTLIGVTWHLLKNWRQQKAVIDQAIQEGKKLQTKLARKTITQDEYDVAVQELMHEYSKKVDKSKLKQALKNEGI